MEYMTVGFLIYRLTLSIAYEFAHRPTVGQVCSVSNSGQATYLIVCRQNQPHKRTKTIKTYWGNDMAFGPP